MSTYNFVARTQFFCYNWKVTTDNTYMGLAVPCKMTETSDDQILGSKTNLLTQSSVKAVKPHISL